MRGFTKRGQAIEARFRGGEMAILLTLTGELIELVGPLGTSSTTPEDDIDAILAENALPNDDPALDRLFPNAYPDDDSASSEFRRYTQADQAAAKVDAAQIVAADVADADDGWVTVPAAHIDAWLITLTNLRLVLAARLDIKDELDAQRLSGISSRHPQAPVVAVFDWCGWMLESVLDCL